MEKSKCFRQLTEAVDLISLLEQLTDSLAEKSQSVESPPWPGIGLTLRRSKQLILSAYKSILSEEGADVDMTLVRAPEVEPVVSQPSSDLISAESKRGLSSPLSGRLRRVPQSSVNGNFREIPSNLTSSSHDSASASTHIR